jgi:hypothetical protein
LNIDLSLEEEKEKEQDLDGNWRDYWMEIILRPKRAIY